IPSRPQQISRLKAPATLVRSSTMPSPITSIPTSVPSIVLQSQPMQPTNQISSPLPDIVQNTLHNNNNPIMTTPVLSVIAPSSAGVCIFSKRF
ncbi:unnamed protein product, partial [Didymodactylos carnosus]